MNTDHPGIIALKNFINAFNTLEKDKIINNLHFPHFTIQMETNLLNTKMVNYFGII